MNFGTRERRSMLGARQRVVLHRHDSGAQGAVTGGRGRQFREAQQNERRERSQVASGPGQARSIAESCREVVSDRSPINRNLNKDI